MKQIVMLTIASLLSILLQTFHMTSDFLYEKGGMSRSAFVIVVLFLVVWLYGTLMLSERRSGYIIIFVGSLSAAGMGIVHTVGHAVGKSNGFFFIWTLIAMGVSGTFSLILSVLGLWSLRRPVYVLK